MTLSRDNLTLSTFFEHVYRPYCLVGGSPRTVEGYRQDVEHWRVLTGDPPLSRLSGTEGQELLLRFRADLTERPTPNGKRRSPHTVNRTLRVVRALLLRAGPRGPRNPEGFDLIAEPPTVRLLKTRKSYVRRLTVAELNALYDACGRSAYMPRLEGVECAQWWRTFLVLAYGTGLRLGALLAARIDHVDWEERTLMVKGDKTGHERPKALRAEVIWHLRQVVGVHSLLLPWPHQHDGRGGDHRINGRRDWTSETACLDGVKCYETIKHTFNNQWHRIVRAAGIERRVRIHDLRKTSASMIAGSQVRAILTAGTVLDHSSLQVTANHYIDDVALEREAVEAMPWPEAFRVPGSTKPGARAKAKPEEVIDQRLAEAVTRLSRELRKQSRPQDAGLFARVGGWLAGVFSKTNDEPGPDLPEPNLGELQEALDAAASRAEDRESALAECSEVERSVLEHLGEKPTSAEDLIAFAGLPPGKVLAVLTALQLRRLVRRVPGNQYVAERHAA